MGWFLALIGSALIVVGVLLGVGNRGGETAGLQVFKANLTGPVWLVIVALGAIILVGVWYIDADHGAPKPPHDGTVPTTLAEAEFVSENPDEPYAYGDDPDLDLLYDRCAEGLLAACDELYQDSPVESEYEFFGATCGERFLEDPPELCTDVPVGSEP